jgi:hypothetical protein
MTDHSTIAQLRDLIPLRPLSLVEALRLAELQATRLLALAEITHGPVPEGVISELPQVDVRYAHHASAPVSGLMQWRAGRYLVVIDGTEPLGRRRFSLAHEAKHALDHPFAATLYPATPALTSRERQEHVCDYFAACLLMPRAWVKAAWGSGIQDVGRLSRRFEVSTAAMRVRLRYLGLTEATARCQITA